MMNENYYFDTVFSPFLFGKYKYSPLFNIIMEDPSYVYWCVNNIPDLMMSNETIDQIKKLLPSFVIPANFESHIGEPFFEENNYKEENYMYEIDTEPSTYERYNGSYAQDEMGYSDDDIDTIFDGDPLAYWNID
jgi:hypothetical protein